MPGWKSEDERRAMGEVLGDVPGPEVVAASTEECGRLLALLKEPRLKEVALAKLQGFTNTEIAARIGCSERTIERELSLIRKLWEHDAPS